MVFLDRIKITALLLLLFLGSCRDSKSEVIEDSGKDGWLKGDDSDKFNTIANQLRGFDMAMVETGYRYQELYWAGKDENWEYAYYQIEKIRKSLENGLERRPKRSLSASKFLNVSLPEMERAIQSHDSTDFFQSFNLFTNACNECHSVEGVSFFSVKIPNTRQSPIRK